jgi:DNA-directed RNA polymerase subunit RPC12/RpoP
MLFICSYSCRSCGTVGLNISKNQIVRCPVCGGEIHYQCNQAPVSVDLNQFKDVLV